MTVTFKDEKVIFSDDHEYTSIIWVMSDGANVPFSDYFDQKRLYGVKVDKLGYARLRALAAVYIRPHLRWIHLEKIIRTLYWGDSVYETAESLSRELDIGMTMMSKELAPLYEEWEKLLAEHGPEPFATTTRLREHFPELLQKEGARIAAILQEHGAGLQESKKSGWCRRGDGRYDHGSGGLFTIIGPLLSAAIAELTGTWPERELKPGDGYRLTYVGSNLVQVEPQWIDLAVNEDGIWLNNK